MGGERGEGGGIRSLMGRAGMGRCGKGWGKRTGAGVDAGEGLVDRSVSLAIIYWQGERKWAGF